MSLATKRSAIGSLKFLVDYWLMLAVRRSLQSRIDYHCPKLGWVTLTKWGQSVRIPHGPNTKPRGRATGNHPLGFLGMFHAGALRASAYCWDPQTPFVGSKSAVDTWFWSTLFGDSMYKIQIAPWEAL